MSVNQTPMGGNFDMGRVVKATFAAAQKHFVTLLVGSIVLTGVPQLISLAGMGGTSASNPTAMFSSPAYLVGMILTLVGSFMFQGYVIHTVVRGHKGLETSIPEAFSAAASKIVPLFILSILVGLGVAVGMIFLIVPGVILLVMWSVGVPAVVVEGASPVQALGRSRALTKGSRWAIFGLVIVAVLLSYAISMAVYGFNFAAMAAAASTPASPQLIGSVIISTLTSVLYGCGAASVYSELRMIKEGIGNDQLASVFE